jgi:tetratricopeptide (TPR) repeat protein
MSNVTSASSTSGGKIAEMPAKRRAAGRQPLKPSIICIALVCLGIVAYSNSLRGPFIFDDLAAICDNPDFGGTSVFGFTSTTLTARPVLWLSFKINFAIAGFRVEAYHVTNLLIHLAVGLLLFGIVRRNLLRKETWGDRFEQSAIWLAAAVAAIWMVHPLTTAAVTYIVQRAESLAAMFYLLVIYCLIRSADSNPRASPAWNCGAVAACVLGMMTKETLASAPLVALLYDRTFLAGSFLAALKIRRWLYGGLAATWGILALLVIQSHGRGDTVGFHLGVSATDYARTQLGVIAHYFALAFWPGGLVIDAADWPVAHHWNQIGIPGLLIAVLILLSLVALWKWPRIGFLLACIFLILAPSSSVVPIVTEIEADQRMYLPLAALVALVVVGGWTFAQRWRLTRVAIALAPAVIAVLITFTFMRNSDYHSALEIWADAIEKRPNDWTAHCGYGQALAGIASGYAPLSPQQKAAAGWAVPELRRAIELKPTRYISAAWTLSAMLELSGDQAASEQFDTQLIAQYPDRSVRTHRLRGEHRLNRGDLDGAAADFNAVIAMQPNDIEAHYCLGVIMQMQRDVGGAQLQFRRVLELAPHYLDAEKRLTHLQNIGGSNSD